MAILPGQPLEKPVKLFAPLTAKKVTGKKTPPYEGGVKKQKRRESYENKYLFIFHVQIIALRLLLLIGLTNN